MKKVLVVEDEIAIRELVVDALQFSGYITLRASDGYEALQVLDEQLPDLVITDIMMPQMDGREVLRQIRSTPRYATLPVIITSALRGSAGSFEQDNRTSFLAKPFDPTSLLQLVAYHIGRP